MAQLAAGTRLPSPSVSDPNGSGKALTDRLRAILADMRKAEPLSLDPQVVAEASAILNAVDVDIRYAHQNHQATLYRDLQTQNARLQEDLERARKDSSEATIALQIEKETAQVMDARRKKHDDEWMARQKREREEVRQDVAHKLVAKKT